MRGLLEPSLTRFQTESTASTYSAQHPKDYSIRSDFISLKNYLIPSKHFAPHEDVPKSGDAGAWSITM